MRLVSASLVAIIAASALWPRAGGGGSYRSSSGSRSSSSSSYRSSSSSSYRSSSSSSGSSSSSHRSSSYSSGPSYRSLTDFISTNRVYDFSTPGQLVLVETITFKPTALVGYYTYRPAGLNIPWEINEIEYDKKLLNNATKTEDQLHFHYLSPAKNKENLTLTFKSQLEISPIPTNDGAIVILDAACNSSQTCSVHLKSLPDNSRLTLTKKILHEGVREIVTRKSEMTQGTVVLAAKVMQEAGPIYIKLPTTDHRAAAISRWQKANFRSSVVSTISVDMHGVVNFHAATEFATKPIYLQVKMMPGHDRGKTYLLANTQNVMWGSFSSYGTSELSLDTSARDYGYRSLGNVYMDSENRQLVRISIPALMTSGSDYHARQTKTTFVAQQKSIRVELPGGIEVNPLLYECLNPTFDKCVETRSIETELVRDGSNITLYPTEVQTASLWLLDLKVIQGEFKGPGIFNYLRFAFAHHHKFGRHPRWVFFFYLLLTIGILTGIIFLLMRASRRKRRREEEARILKVEQQALAKLIKRDSKFQIEAFKARGRLIAEKIQHAWSIGDMKDCRRFLSQGVFNRFQIQLKIMREFEKRQNLVADFAIKNFYVVRRQTAGPYDALTLRLDAVARDTFAPVNEPSDASQRRVMAARQQKFTEYYTFMRRQNAQTTGAENIDQCSHCGTPFKAEGETSKCRSCGAVMGSGEFDWVLAEITQQSEYDPRGGRKNLPGAVSADRIEDRASFLFWRQVLARLHGNPDLIQRDATEGFLQTVFAPEELTDIAVGAVDLEEYNDVLSPIQAYVRVKWSAKGKNDKGTRHRESVLGLAVKSEFEEGAGFADHGCDNCGGPLPETDSAVCSYCQSPIQRQNADWLLDRMETKVE
jgi:uncharacterized Zn finger protein (UPF0148 family)